MPTFSAIALDRLLDPSGASESLTPLKTEKLDIPPSARHRRSNTVSGGPAVAEKKVVQTRPQMSPALYTTPESTPIPDSPTSSFPPSSPYLINHKRRGPRLMKTLSETNVAAAVVAEKTEDEAEPKPKPVSGHLRSLSEDNNMSRELKEEAEAKPINVHFLRSSNGADVAEEVESNGKSNAEFGSEGCELNVEVGSSSERDGGETEDFFDPQESMSYTSNTDCEDYCANRSKMSSSTGEFFDAAEELSSDSGRHQQRSLSDVEIELREMRLSFLMEMEKRKQAEEALNIMRSQWQIVREKLTSVGLILPEDLSALSPDSQSEIDPTEDICQQIELARFVSESIGRGIARSEAEAEMDAQLEVKNFEIARLADRLNYYETMNKEMSQRNQEAIEEVRCQREKKRRRQKWVWGSIASAITLGSVALAWSYMPSERGSSSSSTTSLEAPETDSNLQ